MIISFSYLEAKLRMTEDYSDQTKTFKNVIGSFD